MIFNTIFLFLSLSYAQEKVASICDDLTKNIDTTLAAGDTFVFQQDIELKSKGKNSTIIAEATFEDPGVRYTVQLLTQQAHPEIRRIKTGDTLTFVSDTENADYSARLEPVKPNTSEKSDTSEKKNQYIIKCTQTIKQKKTYKDMILGANKEVPQWAFCSPELVSKLMRGDKPVFKSYRCLDYKIDKVKFTAPPDKRETFIDL